MKLNDSLALITGAASGLGYATARRLAAAGARVVGIDLPDAVAQSPSDDPNIRLLGADVRDPGAVQAAIDEAAAWGPLRVVVNCAGVGDPARTISRDGPLSLDRFRRVIDINLIGTFNVTRLAAATIAATEPVDGERGVVINTASVAAYDGQIGQASYAASKGAIASMTLPLARDLSGQLIRVMAIAPGMFDTPILQGLSEPARESIASQVPHPRRLGHPDEFAALVEHIVVNPMLNGETIRLDGAIRMAPR
ncbi:3-hydroxy-2-methylbutyryl-CoA dehydrogenase [Mycolicibacterium peregrinum]|uniref:SDR family NAD(P)-dependent oxidoreductase n=1 Tax=Mycolicibacterium peregrinum TaxID=43304 RepID=UPI0007EAB5A0|nr:SDR family NAD(P)-dependent oxidoreductase [Mycolicibacterium peregrinum]OBF37430.1 3-hydroxy-2-methylbutyryl-CoA dehydrogenase [Mycolicibacterium peregrinum]